MTLYAGATGADPAVLARGVTTAAGVSAILPASPVALGVTVHMTLAVTLGVALAFVWSALRAARPGLANPYPVDADGAGRCLGRQFLCRAADRQPGFRPLVPYAVSLTSKLLFGVAAAAVLRRQGIAELPLSVVRGG